MNFAELTKRIKLSPSRKTEYFLKYRSFIEREKLFLEEMIRISYNLGRNDVIEEDIQNHKRLFPESKEIFRDERKRGKDSERSEDNLTGLKSNRGKNVRTKQTVD